MIKEAIANLCSGRSLSMEEAAQVMEEIMTEQATPAQLGAFLIALRLKGETAEEMAGMAQVMRQKAQQVVVEGLLVDTCGTGGGPVPTFNISTVSALVVAGAGVKVAKHGNRAITSSCGSADILEARGVKIDLGPEGVARCLREVGIGFMFAPVFHPATRYAAGPRREIGVRTVFNILGPLTNPARCQVQVLGVSDPAIGEKMARVLGLLGCQRAWVVHGSDGMDEITLSEETQVWELRDGRVGTLALRPKDFGLSRVSQEELKGGTVEASAQCLDSVLKGEVGPRRDVVVANAAAAIYLAGMAPGLNEGVRVAQGAIDSGKALGKLRALAQLSSSLK